MGEVGSGDDRAVDLHALLHAHELRRGVERGALALGVKNRRREARRRALAVGTGHLQAVVAGIGTLELVQHLHHGLEQRTRRTRDLAGIVRRG